MGGSNPISKAAGWATKQAGGGTLGKIVGTVINADPMVRMSQGRGVEQNLIAGKPLDFGTSYLMGGEAPARKAIQIGGSAGGAGMTELEGAELYNTYINKTAANDLAAGRSANTNALLAQAMGMSKGLSGAENAALRSNALSQIQQQQGAATRDLRGQLAGQGVRGGLAAALNQQQAAKGVEAVSGAERNLVADNFNSRLQGMQSAAMMNTNQENIERDLMRGKLETIMTLRGQNMGLQGAQMQAQAAANAGRGGKK